MLTGGASCKPKRLMSNAQDKLKDHKTEQVKTILTDWNPLGSLAEQYDDLNNYETEANDILFYIESGIDFPKRGNEQKRIQKIVKELFNETFNLWLTDEECKEPAIKIKNVVKEK